MGVLPAERGREAGEMPDIMHGHDFMIGARSTLGRLAQYYVLLLTFVYSITIGY